MTGRRAEPVPSAWLVDHVLAIHAEDGWVLQRAAYEATLERVRAARTRELRVRGRPVGGRPFGRYHTGAPGRGGRAPWETTLSSISPLRASCGCPDFLRNALGVCEHVFTVLADLAERPRVLARATRSSAEGSAPVLSWDPIRPTLGAEPWWARLRSASKRPRFARGWIAAGDGALRPPPHLADAALTSTIRACARYARRHPERVSPAARAMVERDRADDAAPGPEVAAAMRSLRRLRQPLYPHQREGVRRVIEGRRLLLADDMGLGKTAQAIGACHALHHGGLARRSLVVVPAALRSQWEAEWRSFTDAPVTVVDGRPDARRALYDATDAGTLIVSYAVLRRDADHLAEWAPDVVVLDEAQRIKNGETRTKHAVMALSPRYRLALTGTPMENRLPELASLMEWVDDHAIAPRWRLEPVHGGVGLARHLDTLRERLAPTLLRRRRAAILPDLPPRTDTQVSVSMCAEQLDRHHELDLPIARLVAIGKRRPLRPDEQLRLISLMTQQRVIANGIAQADFDTHWPRVQALAPTESTLDTLGAPKLMALRDTLRRLVVEEGRRVVVFSQWRRALRLACWATRDVLTAADARAVFFTGRESARARDRSLVELHDDPRTRVLFASDAGGVGLNLQRAVDACVHLELPWNPAVFEQRVARIHRLGQTSPIEVVTLTSTPSIEDRIGGLVGAKRALFEGLFDSDASAVVMHDRTLVQRLAEQLDRPADLGPEPASPVTRQRRELESGDLESPDIAVAGGDPSCESLGDRAAALWSKLDPIGPAEPVCGSSACDASAGDAPVSDAFVGDAFVGDAFVGDAPVCDAPMGSQATPDEIPRREATARSSDGTDLDTMPQGRVAEAIASPGVAPPVHGPRSRPVASLFDAVAIERSPDGGITIRAPNEVAGELAALLAGMARLVGAAASAVDRTEVRDMPAVRTVTADESATHEDTDPRATRPTTGSRAGRLRDARASSREAA